MSFVGPRPHASSHNEFYKTKILGYSRRHLFKPGLTGLAQVSGSRGATSSLADMQKRLEYDLSYQDNWSFRLDFTILLKTIIVSFTKGV